MLRRRSLMKKRLSSHHFLRGMVLFLFILAIVATYSLVTALPATAGINYESRNIASEGTWISLENSLSSGQPKISVAPEKHDFGIVTRGKTSGSQTFTISNTGSSDLVLSIITISGTNATEFSIQNDGCSEQSIGPSESCTVDVVFSPTSFGPKSAQLSIPSNDPETPTLDVALIGTGSDELLGDYEPGDKEFEQLEIGDSIVYFHQRMIDDAIVEKDFIVYEFNRTTGELIDKTVHWLSGLPEHITIDITKEKAESMVEGEVQFTELYIISPDSDVFPLDPTPENPCWVVRSIDDDNSIVTIIDAITGEMLGHGVPPPEGGFTLSGPQYSNPCSGVWTGWYQNAASWFNTMGYVTEAVEWPTETQVMNHIQNPDTSLFYELAHGSSTYFSSGCTGGTNYEYTYASEIETWISSYRKMPFTFIGSCGGMCDTGDNTLSYEFGKGSSIDTATVGYCGMAEEHCSSCWSYSIQWQDALFTYMNNGDAVKTAFDKAQVDYPMCASAPSCLRFAGDESFAVVTISYTISGHVRTSEGNGISGVVMNGLPNSPITDSSGFYSAQVDQGWSGKVTPQKSHFIFTPPNRSYSNVNSDQTNQNYIGSYEHCGTITSNETWSSSGNVHVVTCDVTVPLGVTLTVEEGAIVVRV
jgi:hypothetical protein